MIYFILIRESCIFVDDVMYDVMVMISFWRLYMCVIFWLCYCWIMCSGFANCTPGVVRVRFGGGSDKDDVSVSRITCITSGYVRRFWLRVPFGADFHLYQPTSPVVTVAHGSDCGRGGGKLQVSATVYYLRQPDVIN
ncbi:Ketol-acid reductoisomerase (NADP(+)) [Dirofilaria immitis]